MEGTRRGKSGSIAFKQRLVPIANAVLTCDTEEQARSRAATKGAEAARVAVEMANTLREIGA